MVAAGRAPLLVALLACACAPEPLATAAHPTSAPVDAAADAPARDAGPDAADAAAHAAAEPAYDLAADRVQILARARTELGADVHATVSQEKFVLIAAPGWNMAALAASRELTLGALDAFYNHRFGARPAQAVAIYLFPSAAPYQAWCKEHLGGACLSRFGSYHPDRRVIVMNAGLGLGTLTHELVHPIVEADFPKAPTWINEGIASLFEAPVLTGPGEITGAKNWRLPRLRAALSAKDADARVSALFGMSDATFRGDKEDLHYAVARYVCQWLDEKGSLFSFYQRWRDSVDSDPTGEKAFAAVVGQSPSDVNAAWIKWVAAL